MTSYPAKLPLFGEHTVNLGSQALAMPLPLFSGKWKMEESLSSSNLLARQMQLPQLADYLDQLQQRGALLANLDVAAFRQALREGLVFESSIPTGYGVGSSGALVAAIFGGFENGKWETGAMSILELKQALAQIEAFFHGTSSGTDPLVCFLQKTILLGGADGAKIAKLSSASGSPNPPQQIFLLDTSMRRQATPLIAYFMKKMEDVTFAAFYHSTLKLEVEGAIDAFLQGDSKRLFMQFHCLGGLQFELLTELIPPKFHNIWQQGLEGDLYKLKVCGAGGGGFLLGITPDFEKTKATLADYELLPVLTV
jgi:mevalonate kinase